MVRLQGVGLSIGRQPGHAILRELSFSIPAGGFRWLLGASGAGKTSLLRLLTLAVRPTQGRLDVLGAPIHATKRSGLPPLRRRIGVVYQDFRLLPHLSAFDNVALPLRLAGRPEDQLRADVEEMLLWVTLTARAHARPAELSGGEQQRVAIARAVITRPALLVADEPTGNLDDTQAERLMALLAELNRLGTTVVVATHSASLVERHPARALVLAGGALVRDDGKQDEAKQATENPGPPDRDGPAAPNGTLLHGFREAPAAQEGDAPLYDRRDVPTPAPAHADHHDAGGVAERRLDA